jgi:serine protease Do
MTEKTSGSGVLRSPKAGALRKFLISASAAALVIGATAIATSPAMAAGSPESFAPLVDKVKDAVVNISSSGTNVGEDEEADGDQDAPGQQMPALPPGSPLEQLFKGMRPPQQAVPHKATSLGSGFIVDPSGFVVTNNHVVKNGTDIKVTLADGTILPAKLIGHDERTDLAVLKVEAGKPLPAVAFGSSAKERVGDWVLAVGNPFGLGGSVTAGIVSASGRDIHAGPYDDFLQIDAAINRGNSGGPTFNMNGEVIGVNTAILSPSGGSVGIGFAIPSDIVKPVVAQLEQHGNVRRGWLGVAIQAITPDMAEALGLTNVKGALVSSVTPDSPAAKAGVKTGDVILSFDDKPVAGLRDLTMAVADTPIGSVGTLQVKRGKENLTLKATVAELKDEPKLASNDASPGAADTTQTTSLGVRVAGLDSQTRKHFHVPKDVSGVVIVAINPNGVAAERGMEVGDVIERVNELQVKSPADLTQGIKQVTGSGKKALALLVNRQGTEQFVAVQLGSS